MTSLQQVMVRGSYCTVVHIGSATETPSCFNLPTMKIDQIIRLGFWSGHHFSMTHSVILHHSKIRTTNTLHRAVNSCLLWCAQNQARMFQMTLGILSYNIVNVSLKMQFVRSPINLKSIEIPKRSSLKPLYSRDLFSD